MDKFDKYYLKRGKLELSILDEEDMVIDSTIVDKEKVKKVPQVKLNKEIYNTLQTMGKFLTDTSDEASDLQQVKLKKQNKKSNVIAMESTRGSSESIDKSVAIIKKDRMIKSEAIKSTQARELEEAVKAMYKKALEQAEEIRHSEAEIAAITEQIMKPINNIQEDIHLYEKNIFEEEKNLGQGSVDKILFDYFGETKPKHEEGRRLKQYIDQKIALIENYS